MNNDNQNINTNTQPQNNNVQQVNNLVSNNNVVRRKKTLPQTIFFIAASINMAFVVFLLVYFVPVFFIFGGLAGKDRFNATLIEGAIYVVVSIIIFRKAAKYM